ncbi:hypothetical protein [Psychrobacillus sp. FJAT-21963]|uniref:hypothetical protein n=1 Tax=Psychrobacillus sp. FJAT-21963 TaxID=1712028 RepID=UPI0012E30B8D|nr:hypothetical protein [Psychrobacillus sp. FJAT-21963]
MKDFLLFYKLNKVSLYYHTILSEDSQLNNYVLNQCGKEETVQEGKDVTLEGKNVDYAYEFTKGLEEFKTNEKLGYRTAGSEPELKTVEKIEEG